MSHPAVRVAHTTALLHQVWSTNWNELYKGSIGRTIAPFSGRSTTELPLATDFGTMILLKPWSGNQEKCFHIA